MHQSVVSNQFRLATLPILLTLLATVSGCIPGVDDAANGLQFPTSPLSPYAFAYVAGPTGLVAQLRINNATGQISHNGYIYGGDSSSGVTFSTDAQRRFGVVPSPDGLQVYSIDPGTGKLSFIPLGGGPPGVSLGLGWNPRYAVMGSTGSHLYVSDDSTLPPAVLGFDLDNAGNLTQQNGGLGYAAGSNPLSLTPDPQGRFLYVVDNGVVPCVIYSLPVNSDGTLGVDPAPLTVPASVGLIFLTLHPNGKFAYVVDDGNSTIYALAVGSNGALSLIDATGGATPGTPVTLSGSASLPFQFIIHPSGKFGYTPNAGTNNISIFEINSTTGALTELSPSLLSPTAALPNDNPIWLNIDPAGTHVYLVGAGTADITTYNITDQNTGALAQSNTLNLWQDPIYLAIVQPPAPVNLVPRLAFVLGQLAGSISAYLIDPASGGLTLGSTVATGMTPVATAVHPCGCFVYAVGSNAGTPQVSGFIVDPDTGTLAPIGTWPFTLVVTPAGVAIDPSGRLLYVTDNTTGGSDQFLIAPDTGVLTALGTGGSGGSNPTGVVAEPSGQAFFGADNISGSTDTSIFGIDPIVAAATIWVASQTASPPDSGSAGLDVDPGGRFVYIANGGSSNVSGFFWNQVPPTPGFTQVAAPITAGIPGATGPFVAVAVHPSGQWAYTLINSAGANTIAQMVIDPSSSPPGALTVGQSLVPAGTNGTATSMSIEPTGKFLYVADDVATGDIYIYSIDPGTGFLTQVGRISTNDFAVGMATWGALRPSTALGCGGCGQITTTW